MKFRITPLQPFRQRVDFMSFINVGFITSLLHWTLLFMPNNWQRYEVCSWGRTPSSIFVASLILWQDTNLFSSPSRAVDVAALHSSYYVSSRMKAMVEVPCRPTMQEIQDRRRSSITEHKLSKRRGLSLPNLEVAHSISFQRNEIVTRIIMPGSGEEV